MTRKKTFFAIDAKGDLWILGPWSGLVPHFRRNLGLVTEEALGHGNPETGSFLFGLSTARVTV